MRVPTKHQPRTTRGFTLIELMVVIVILGGLIAIVGPNVFGSQERADRSAAGVQISNFCSAVDQYVLVHKRPPESLEALTQATAADPQPFMREIPNDPWGNSYTYRVDGANYSIRSFGRDGQPDTADDVVWPKPK
jgi:general secretion pathway protein G